MALKKELKRSLTHIQQTVLAHFLYHSRHTSPAEIFDATQDTLAEDPFFRRYQRSQKNMNKGQKKDSKIKEETISTRLMRTFKIGLKEEILKICEGDSANEIENSHEYQSLNYALHQLESTRKQESPFGETIHNRSKIEIYSFPNENILFEELGRALCKEIERILRFRKENVEDFILVYFGQTLKRFGQSFYCPATLSNEAINIYSKKSKDEKKEYSVFLPVIGDIVIPRAEPRIFRSLNNCTSNQIANIFTEKLYKTDMKMDETEDVIFFANTQPAFIISKPVEKASFVNTLKVNSTNDDISKDRRTLIEKSSSLLFSLGSTIKRKGRDNNFQKIYSLLYEDIDFSKDGVAAEILGRSFDSNGKPIGEPNPGKYISISSKAAQYSNLNFLNLGLTISELKNMVDKYDELRLKYYQKDLWKVPMGATLIVDNNFQGKERAVAIFLKMAEGTKGQPSDWKLFNRIYCTREFLNNVEKEYMQLS